MQKLVAGSKLSASCRATGFTLIEILVVLTIVALALAIVVPSISNSMSVSVHDIARDMQISLRQTRAKAVSEQQSSLFWINTQRHEYLTHKGKVKAFSETIQIHTKVAASEVQGAQAGVRFFPDGSSTGGRLTLNDLADVSVQIDIDWLTGRVSVVDEN